MQNAGNKKKQAGRQTADRQTDKQTGGQPRGRHNQVAFWLAGLSLGSTGCVSVIVTRILLLLLLLLLLLELARDFVLIFPGVTAIPLSFC